MRNTGCGRIEPPRESRHGLGLRGGGLEAECAPMTPVAGYYSYPRPELVELMLAECPARGRVLDVGCAAGVFGAALLEAGFSEVVGVEPVSQVADVARGRLTKVITAAFPDPRVCNEAPFDHVIFADSLEHMADPWAALGEARGLLAPGGQLILSVPNVSHYKVIVQLLGGKWTYEDLGLLDRTHLRFFTESSIRRDLKDCGFSIVSVRHTALRPGRRYRPVELMFRWWLPHLFVQQVCLVAVSSGGPPE